MHEMCFFSFLKEYLIIYHKFILELDDGAYNPLWTSKGSIQTFHFWKVSIFGEMV